MSEESDTVATSSEFSVGQLEENRDEPPAKKTRQDNGGLPDGKHERLEQRLEQRLGGILCCAVCLDLPRTSIYQCGNGHLMCAGCFTHLLADARLREETASCPNCRMAISKDLCSRNLAVEKAVCELPTQCQFCSKELPRAQIEHHETNLCEDRLTWCRYSRIGCQWHGPYHELSDHQIACAHPNKTGLEVMGALEVIDQKNLEEQQLYIRIFDLLSFEKITFNDLQFKPYRTDEFVHKLYYETSRFSAFNNQWVVKSLVNDNQRDPTQSCERCLTYQLVLKSKITSSLGVHFIILKGPFGDMKVSPRLYHHVFTETQGESPYLSLPLCNSAEANRLLASKAINFRLIMFQVSK